MSSRVVYSLKRNSRFWDLQNKAWASRIYASLYRWNYMKVAALIFVTSSPMTDWKPHARRLKQQEHCGYSWAHSVQIHRIHKQKRTRNIWNLWPAFWAKKVNIGRVHERTINQEDSGQWLCPKSFWRQAKGAVCWDPGGYHNKSISQDERYANHYDGWRITDVSINQRGWKPSELHTSVRLMSFWLDVWALL